jgi:prepilin peptidase CpaA
VSDPRIPTLVVFLAVSLAAVTDLRRFKVSNVLTFFLLVSGLVFHAVTGGWSGFGLAAAGAAFGFFVLLSPYLAGGMGAGDVKLLTGVGAWLGMAMTYKVVIASALAGGLYALVLMIASGRARETWIGIKKIVSKSKLTQSESVQSVAQQENRHRRLVPFAAMVAVGLLATIARP